MLTEQFAREFSAEWIAAWNAHDLPRVLSHYADEFVMSSPFIKLMGVDPSGTLSGKDMVGAYWAKALERLPDLHFELIDATVGVDSVAIYYRAVLGKKAVEVFFFDEARKVVRACAHYDSI